jgi:hypothetical protein
MTALVFSQDLLRGLTNSLTRDVQPHRLRGSARSLGGCARAAARAQGASSWRLRRLGRALRDRRAAPGRRYSNDPARARNARARAVACC